MNCWDDSSNNNLYAPPGLLFPYSRLSFNQSVTIKSLLPLIFFLYCNNSASPSPLSTTPNSCLINLTNSSPVDIGGTASLPNPEPIKIIGGFGLLKKSHNCLKVSL